ncbi:MAG: NUDIX domain-containing protein [Kurthia sp.]|nr:NUDIX domain-containing protein [Candidatus Kurthia equi]
MRKRAGVIIIKNNKLALIKRIKNEEIYYVIPGGQKEAGETLQQAAIREAKEELGVYITLGKRVVELTFNGQQIYFLATIIGGGFGTGKGEEFSRAEECGSYEAVWLSLDELQQHDVRPREVIEYIKTAGPKI